MRLNSKTPTIHTHEGATAKHINPEQKLHRTLMCCMLWEDSFYEDGVSIADRITSLVPKVDPKTVADMAVEVREKMKLRHVPLLLVREMARLPLHKAFVAQTLAKVIQRPDELTEFLSIYWKDKRQPLSAQVKKGLAKAFLKFNEYSLAKYNQENAIKLRDVLFLSHARPEDKAQEELFKKLVDGTLKTPDTWEVKLSAGKEKKTEAEKKASWEELLKENKLGALALLRNLRNFRKANVDPNLVKNALSTMKTERVLPFRFISAAKHAPDLEPQLEQAMFKCLQTQEKLPGKTFLLVDVSGSMDSAISGKSDLQRLDAACGLAMLLREVCDDFQVGTFSEVFKLVPPRRGFALRDAIVGSQHHSSTYLGRAVELLSQAKDHFDRVIVLTDEQSHDAVKDPKWKHSWMINVAAYKNGVGYGPWKHIDGWSEAVIDYLRVSEDAERS